MHQAVRQFARVGKQEQAFGIQIQTANRLPLALLQAREFTENGRAILRIIVRHHFASWLVISQNARARRRNAQAQQFAIDA